MAIITEDYVSFETAKLLKENGFDIPCDNYYDSSGKTPNESVYGGANIETLDYNADPFVKSGFSKFKTFSAPTLQMAMKWLVREHRLYVNVAPSVEGYYWTEKWHSYVEELNKRYPFGKFIGTFNSTEEAAEAGIKYALENLI